MIRPLSDRDRGAPGPSSPGVPGRRLRGLVVPLGAALVVLGGLLVADSVRRGEASLWVVVIVPVVSGNSPELLAGVFAVLLGLVTLTARWQGDDSPPTPDASAPPTRTTEAGGFLLIGPFPIVFGRWRGPDSTLRWARAVGLALLLLFVAGVVLAVYLDW